MPRIQAIRLKNLRALADTGVINLRPITLLVGKNSAGKSTFARIFPLLRQSSEGKRRAPVLWWGKYVDFGSFREAVRRDCDEKEISISLRISVEVNDDLEHSEFWLEEFSLAETTDFEVEVVLAEASDGGTFVKRTHIAACGLDCTVNIDSQDNIESITCGAAAWTPEADTKSIAVSGELIPELKFMRPLKGRDVNRIFYRDYNPFTNALYGAVQNLAHGNTTPEKIAEIAEQIPIGTAQAVLDSLKRLNGPKSLRRTTASLDVNGVALEDLRSLPASKIRCPCTSIIGSGTITDGSKYRP